VPGSFFDSTNWRMLECIGSILQVSSIKTRFPPDFTGLTERVSVNRQTLSLARGYSYTGWRKPSHLRIMSLIGV